MKKYIPQLNFERLYFSQAETLDQPGSWLSLVAVPSAGWSGFDAINPLQIVIFDDLQLTGAHSQANDTHSQPNATDSQVNATDSQLNEAHSQLNEAYSQVNARDSQVNEAYSQLIATHSQVMAAHSHVKIGNLINLRSNFSHLTKNLYTNCIIIG